MTVDESQLDPPGDTPNEWNQSERPMILQLMEMGWKYQKGDTGVPELSEREDFKQVLLKDRLREAIKRINGNDGPVNDIMADRVIMDLENAAGTGSIIERNKRVTEKLLNGSYQKPADGSVQSRLFRYIALDPDKIGENDFLAMNQFKVQPPGGRSAIIPDVVLFVNGIPLVVVECKSPSVADPLEEAINQLLRYSNQRSWIEDQEGAEQLFLYNQLMVATSFYHAKVSTLGGQPDHYKEWKTTNLFTNDHVAEWTGKDDPKDWKPQELLTAGLLNPLALLDVFRDFILFKTEEGRLTKMAPRYQQFRATHEAVNRLKNGKKKGDSARGMDERGGVVWHTQGSGKSITMVYIVRKMRRIRELCGYKVVVVTDRTDLEDQLRETAELSGQTVRPDADVKKGTSSKTEVLKGLLRQDSPDLVFALAQLYLDRSSDDAIVLEYEVPKKVNQDAEAGNLVKDVPDSPPKKLKTTIREATFETLNESDQVLLLIDECHRSHTDLFHANMMKALPNAAKIGFTGTPILRSNAANTQMIFGSFIDKYKMRQSEEDGSTVPIRYEGRTAEGLVESTAKLDAKFDNLFADRTEQELNFIRNKYAGEGDVLEAPKLIAEKAKDMLEHYVSEVLPNGFKAQVVATSRLASVRYRDSLADERDKLVAEIEQLDSAILDLSDEDLEEQDERAAFLVRASKHLDLIKALEFGAVISGGHNDPPAGYSNAADWRRWTEESNQKDLIKRFKRSLGLVSGDKSDPLAFLCVKSKLTTGFDAPVEQVMYLDRKTTEHDLLQTIARVNRKAKGKEFGLIVDYIGLTHHLTEALGDYEDEPEPPMMDRGSELPKLRDLHQLVLKVFSDHGITVSVDTVEACVDLLADVKIRADFMNKLKAFLQKFSLLANLPEAQPYRRDVKILGFIAAAARHTYYDETMDLHGVQPKVKALIDEFVSANGINPKIKPVEILSLDFEEATPIEGASAKTRATRMLHAMRHHIDISQHENPSFFKKISEKIQSILDDLQDQWEKIEEELRALAAALRDQEVEEVAGLDSRIHIPFYQLLADYLDKEQDDA